MPLWPAFTIYGDLASGNCQKVKLVADHLGLTYDWIDVDITKGESRTAEYLQKFPNGQVPAVDLGDGRRLAQSNAIIRFLASGTPLLPNDPWQQAKIDEWLFWEQYSHEPYIAVCRFHMLYKGEPKETREAWRVERGEAALDTMNGHLDGRDWFAGDAASVADVALFAYTRVAHEGGFDMAARPHVERWIARCADTFATNKQN